MKKNKNKLSSFIDNEKYFLRYGKYRDGSEVFYKRLSDGETSIGKVKWFERNNEGAILVTVIDMVIKNFQSCFFDDIIENPNIKVVKKLRSKL